MDLRNLQPAVPIEDRRMEAPVPAPPLRPGLMDMIGPEMSHGPYADPKVWNEFLRSTGFNREGHTRALGYHDIGSKTRKQQQQYGQEDGGTIMLAPGR